MKKSKDEFGDRMKTYEKNNVLPQFPKGLPIVARIDGRSFSKFTKDMKRPFDHEMTQMMTTVTQYLVEHTGADLGYTQSDEITLVWKNPTGNSEIWFGGKLQKMVSQLAAQATVFFNFELAYSSYSNKFTSLPTFDARVWFVPCIHEACNAVLWRIKDATKNSVSMLARSHFSAKELHRKSGEMMKKMLLTKNQSWEDVKPEYTHGTLVYKKKVVEPYTLDELKVLPPKHEAKINPDLKVERTRYETAHARGMDWIVLKNLLLGQ